jgi:hypothetical protein
MWQPSLELGTTHGAGQHVVEELCVLGPLIGRKPRQQWLSDELMGLTSEHRAGGGVDGRDQAVWGDNGLGDARLGEALLPRVGRAHGRR